MHAKDTMRRLGLGLCLLVSVGLETLGQPPASPRGKTQDWPYYGGPGQTRYSPLKQITRENVNQLQVAWTFDTKETANYATETQPIMVNGVFYGLTPTHEVIALDAATGKLLWKYDSGIAGRGPNRGLTYWTDGKAQRIFVGVGLYLYAIDARTGKASAGFGRDGRVDLREGLGRDPGTLSLGLDTPGVVYKNLLIVGGRMGETRGSPPGDIRAYDARTGKIRWTFHTIPHPGEFGYDTWPKDAWTYAGSANSWAGMALDEKRGLVFVPTGSASSDFYGFDRHGDNLFANSVIALKADTGERVWHFQGVKHDIWDRDFDSPPTLVSIKRNGKTIDAVAQTSKQGWLYLLDRTTGKPLFPIELRSYPPSTVPGEQAADTQGLPTKPAPLSRQRLTEEMLTNRTPEAHQWAVEKFRTLRSDGQFLPFALGQDTVLFPGFDGGAEWGGSAFDPETGLIYVNANDVPWWTRLVENKGGTSSGQLYLSNCASCHRDDMRGSVGAIPSLIDLRGKRNAEEIAAIIQQGGGRMPAFANLSAEQRAGIAGYVLGSPDKELPGQAAPSAELMPYRFTGYNKFLDPDGYPAVVPPWGTLNAIDLSTGEYAWKIPFGEYPELAAKGIKDTGTDNYGGPIVTAGGLVFIGATNFDKKFRAFDKKSGKLLWETVLPQSGNGTPITYEVGGRQYVVICASTHVRGIMDSHLRLGGAAAENLPPTSYVAFALPETGKIGSGKEK